MEAYERKPPEDGGGEVMSKPMSEQMQKLADRYEKATGKKFDAQTNAQKIRAMTDEELGVWICKHALSCGCCVGAELCNRDDGIANGAVKWLQQPAEDDCHSICGATNLPCIRCNPGGCDNRKEGAD